MSTLRWIVVGLVGAAALGGCRNAKEERSASPPDTAGRMPGMRGMQGMRGMPGMMGGEMMDSMGAHLRMMQGVSADSMQAMLPMHRQMVANMLSRMNTDMQSMNMASTADWSALADSVRQDLIRLPELSGAELRRVMPAHGARVMRLMTMHRAMMGAAAQPQR